MGKLARIQELETEIAAAEKRLAAHQGIRAFLEDLAQLPEDAVLLYTLSGQRVQHEIGKSARIALRAL
jgi:hypothetical protein